MVENEGLFNPGSQTGNVNTFTFLTQPQEYFSCNLATKEDSNGDRPSVVFLIWCLWFCLCFFGRLEKSQFVSYVCPFCVSCSLFLFTQTRLKHFYRRRISGTPSIISSLLLFCVAAVPSETSPSVWRTNSSDNLEKGAKHKPEGNYCSGTNPSSAGNWWRLKEEPSVTSVMQGRPPLSVEDSNYLGGVPKIKVKRKGCHNCYITKNI